MVEPIAPTPAPLPQLPKQGTKPDTILRYIAVGVIVLIAVALGIARYRDPEFPIFLAYSILFVVVVAGFSIYYFFKFRKSKSDNKKSLKEPITKLEARQIAFDLTENTTYADYIRYGFKDERTVHVGRGIKSLLYICEAEGKFVKRNYVVMVNMHDPHKKNAVLIEPDEAKIARTLNGLADYPESAPVIEKIRSKNDLLGISTESEIQRPQAEEKELA